MADGDPTAEAQLDALYELPLEVFTPARNQLAQRLSRASERELGEQVKRLRKPSVTAWTLNQLRRRQPEQVQRLLDAGLALREAQERLLGAGERGRLREAAAAERRLVEETVQAAESLLRKSGQSVSTSLHNKLWETTHAAALDPELGDTLRRGRLSQDRQLSDLGLIGGTGVDAPASPARAEPAPPKPAPKNRRRIEQAAQRRQKAQEKLESALRAADEAESQLAHARAAWQSAEAAAARAQTLAARAQAAVAQAREQAAAAADRVDELEAEEQ